MLKHYGIINNKIAEVQKSDASIFIYTDPDDEEKRQISNDYQIDEYTLNSSLDPNELSRLEFEPDHITLIYKCPEKYSLREVLVFKTSTTGIFLYSDKLVIVSPGDIGFLSGKIFNKVSSFPELILKLISVSVNNFMEHLKVINMITDELEGKITKSIENRYLLNLFAVEKSLIFYLNAIDANNVMMSKLKRNEAKFVFTEEDHELIDDIIIENIQCYRQAKIYSNILAGLMDASASIVNNNLNVLMKTLNLITITIMVPSLVVSLFSMNVNLPFGLQESGTSFWLILTMVFFSIAFVLVIWKLKK